jgi:threonine/homoserine/homoserine lactone efflux protein
VPTSTSLAGFAALSFALIVVPGPSVAFVVSRALALGRRAALLTVVGNAIGFFLQVALVAGGLGALVERSVALFTLVKLVGSGYLVWLGLQTVRHRRELAPAPGSTSVPTDRRSVLDGFVVGLANPKAIVFLAAVLPQFVDAGGAPPGVQMALLGLVFVVLALVCDATWGLAAGTARQWMVRSPGRPARLRLAGGAVMIGLGARLALGGRPD